MLIATTMRDNIVAAINANTGGKFQIDNTVPTYFMIWGSCQAFITVWTTSMSAEMSVGTGPPPAGTYNHSHFFQGFNLVTLTNAYQSLFFNTTIALAGGKFVTPPPAPAQPSLQFFTEGWAQELMKFVDSVQLTSNVADGGATHDHKSVIVPPPPNGTHWATLNTPVQISAIAQTIVAGLEAYLITKHGPTKFIPTEPLSSFHVFAIEFAKAFLTEIRNNSVMLPIVGAGHIHILL